MFQFEKHWFKFSSEERGETWFSTFYMLNECLTTLPWLLLNPAQIPAAATLTFNEL